MVCRKTNTEGVSANTSVNPVVSGVFANPVCNSYKHVVAYIFTEDVVDHFEILDVEVGYRIVDIFFVVKVAPDGVEQVLLGEQTCELVMGCLVHFFLLPEDIGSVVLNGQERSDFSVLFV